MRWIAILAWTVRLAVAQDASQISGLVRDPSGASVDRATVTVLHMDSGMRRIAWTGPDGWYAVSSLPAGEYKVTVRQQGFRTVARLGVELPAGEAARLDFDLEIGGMQEFVTIEGDRAAINTEDASSGLAIDGETAVRLPLSGRSPHNLVSFAPGVVITPATLGEAGQFSVNGQRPNANYFVVDGVSANNGVGAAGLPGQFSGGTLPAMTALGTLHTLAAVGELQEMRVMTSTFAPEFGRMPGAQIQLSSRAGSNGVRGDAAYLFRHERLSAADWFANRAGLGRAPLRLNDFSAAVGGPLRPNRTFFFVSGEALRLRQPSAWRIAVPAMPARRDAPAVTKALLDSYPLPRREMAGPYGETTIQTSWPGRVTTGGFRIDQSIGATGALFVRYRDVPSENRVGCVVRNSSRFGTRSFTAGLTTTHETSSINDFRLNVSRSSAESSWFPGLTGEAALAAAKSLLIPQPEPPGSMVYGISIEGLGPLIWSDPSRSRQDQFQIADTLAVTVGRHQVRTGIDYLRLTPWRERALSSVVMNFPSLESLLAQLPPRITYGHAPGGSSRIETLSLFAQDTWSVDDHLKLTYGMRWEYMPPPSSVVAPQTLVALGGGGVAPPAIPGSPLAPPAPALPGVSQDPSWNLRFGRFAPRFGLAWRLNRAGDFVLRSGIGIFYDLGFASAIDPLNGIPFNSWRPSLSTGSPLPPNTGPVYGFSPELRIPYSTQWNVTLERGLGTGGVVSAAWVGSRGRNLLRREGYLQPGADTVSLLVATSHGRSDYHSFQAQYRRSVAQGLRAMASYTWSHSLDNGSWDSGIYLAAGAPNQERASSNFDLRHWLSGALSYDLPARHVSAMARGVSLHALIRARSGFPFDVSTRGNSFGLGFDNAPRPDLAPGEPVWLSDAGVPGGRRLNPAAFRLPDQGPQGNLGRNALRGEGMWQLDAAAERRFKLAGTAAVLVRLQAYNLLNAPAFADPVRVLGNPLFGEPASLAGLMMGTGRPSSGVTPAFQSGGPRTIELSVSLKF